MISTAQILWLTPAELAARLRVCEDTARRCIWTEPGPAPAGKIPGIRIGRQFRVHIKDVEKHEARETAQRSRMAIKAMGKQSAGKDYFADL